MLRAVVFDPRSDPWPAGWSRFVQSEGLAAVWDATAVSALAWCAQAPTYLAVVVDRTDVPVAIFHGRHLGLPADPRRFATKQSRVVGGLVECRLPPTFGLRGYAFAAAADRSARAEALAAYERGLRSLLGRGLAAIVYRNIPPADRGLFGGRRRMWSVRAEPVILNRWSSLDDYLGSLPAKRRSGLSRLHAALPAAGIHAAETGAVDPTAAARLASAVALTHRDWRSGMWPIQPPIPRSYFAALAHRPGVRFLTYGATSGRLLAFATWLESGGELVDSVWGSLGVREGGRRDLYQDHFLRSAGRLIDGGLSRLALGKGLVAMKLRFGAQLEPRYLAAAGW